MTVRNVKDRLPRRPIPFSPDEVYVGRYDTRVAEGSVEGWDGYFGNPFRMEKDRPRVEVLRGFEQYARERIASDGEYRDRVRSLYGKVLCCWCAPMPCHADILERLADELFQKERMDGESAD